MQMVRTKFGFTRIDGTSNDMNTFPIKSIVTGTGCSCSDYVETDKPCECPMEATIGAPESRPLTNYANGTNGRPVARLAPVAPLATNIVDTATNTISGLMNKAQEYYKANPLYVYIGGAVLVYLFTSKKGRSKKFF